LGKYLEPNGELNYLHHKRKPAMELRCGLGIYSQWSHRLRKYGQDWFLGLDLLQSRSRTLGFLSEIVKKLDERGFPFKVLVVGETKTRRL
jgi:hypothetical protein